MSLSTLKELKGASPLGTLISLAAKQFITKSQSEDVYRALVPMLHDQIKRGKKNKDPIIQKAQGVLENLAPFGARRSNFNKRYIGSNEKLLELPLDPNKLSPAWWW